MAAPPAAPVYLQITDVDPLRYGLLFERFLNPERVSMPDIDIDFSVRGRERVMRYVTEKYGRESVAQIVTFGKMFRGRRRGTQPVLGHDYGAGDRLAKLTRSWAARRASRTACATASRSRAPTTPAPTAKQIIDVAKGLEDRPQLLDPCRGRRHRRPAAHRHRPVAAGGRRHGGGRLPHGDAVLDEAGRGSGS